MARTTLTSSRRTERLEARVSPEQKDLFRRAAAIEGRNLSEFIVQNLAEVAGRVVREAEVIQLSDQDRKIFLKEIRQPRKPNKALRDAADRYQRQVKQQ